MLFEIYRPIISNPRSPALPPTRTHFSSYVKSWYRDHLNFVAARTKNTVMHDGDRASDAGDAGDTAGDDDADAGDDAGDAGDDDGDGDVVDGSLLLVYGQPAISTNLIGDSYVICPNVNQTQHQNDLTQSVGAGGDELVDSPTFVFQVGCWCGHLFLLYSSYRYSFFCVSL